MYIIKKIKSALIEGKQILIVKYNKDTSRTKS